MILFLFCFLLYFVYILCILVFILFSEPLYDDQNFLYNKTNMESYLINRGDNSGAALENIDQGILSSQVPMEIPGINLLQISFLKGHFISTLSIQRRHFKTFKIMKDCDSNPSQNVMSSLLRWNNLSHLSKLCWKHKNTKFCIYVIFGIQ